MNLKSTALVTLGAGGIIASVSYWLANRKAKETVAAVENAVATGGSFQTRLTGYWPFSASALEKRMEGGVNDRKGKPLHTLEQHLSDPVKHPYVAVSGDDSVFPYGQRLSISAWPNAIFRVVDTGGHFRGANKVYRVMGREPLDICVDSSKTIVPKEGIVAQIVEGDNFERGTLVAKAGFKGQTVAGRSS